MNASVALDDLKTAETKEDSRFAVPTMRCAGCISKIERGLADLPGVINARVNFSTKQVAVSHSPELTEDKLKSAIGLLGFEAQILTDNPLSEDRGDTKRLLRALAVAGFGMMNIMLLSVSVWSGAIGVTKDLFHWLSALIAIPVIAYSGRPFFASAAMALRYMRTNMDVPISIGIILATGLSLYETATSGPHAYFDGVVMLIFFLLAGRVLDGMMRDRAREGISALLKQTASGAMIIQSDGTTVWTKVGEIEAGMLMLVAAGDNLAADGIIIEGRSGFDFSMLTGESDPQNRSVDDEVLAGTTNLTAPVKVRVTAAGKDTSISDIARLMDEAGQHRSFHVRVADRAARYYAPAVHCLALLAFVGWMLAGVGWHQALLISVAVLIITCPCALGLAVPAAQVVASGALMRKGVLVKDGSALERLAEADRVILDKTGTVTKGHLVPTNLALLSDDQKSVALALAQSSNHPISKAIAKSLIAKNILPAKIHSVIETAGEGVSANWNSIGVSLTRPQNGGNGSATQLTMGNVEQRITLTDEIRPDAETVVKNLSELGLPASLLSGDSMEAVTPVALQLGILAQANAKPEDKVDTIKRLSEQGHKVLMVGDGLNDGPALAAAHVSIAPGSASDVGQQAADAVFTSDSLMPVALAVKVARRTMQTVRQNFGLAIGYNILAVPLALSGMVTPLIAAIAMSTSSLIVVGNALRLYGAAK
ncbi:MAG: heavy metal translocating P-type ATPase [Parasphingorhabdus sp.]